MPKKTHSELTAGLFVIFGVAALLAVVIWLGASDAFRTSEGQAVFFAKESAGSLGLFADSKVWINDREIGTISEIRRDPANKRTLYIVELLKADERIYSNARARVASGLVGGATLVIVDRGSDANAPADENHPVQIAGGLDEAMADISAAAKKLRTVIDREFDENVDKSVLKSIKTILADINFASGKVVGILQVLREEMDANRPGSILADISDVTGNIRRETDANYDKGLLAKAHTGVDGVNAMITDARPKVSRTLDAVTETAEKIRDYTNKDVADLLAQLRQISTSVLKASKNLADAAETAKGLIDRNVANVDETLDNLTLVSDNLKATATDLRRNPWRLFYRPDQKELDSANIKDAARAFADGAAQLDQVLTKLKSMDAKTIEAADLKVVRDHILKTFENFTKAEKALFKELSK